MSELSPFFKLAPQFRLEIEQLIQWLIMHADLRFETDDAKVAKIALRLGIAFEQVPIPDGGGGNAILGCDGIQSVLVTVYRGNSEPSDNGQSAMIMDTKKLIACSNNGQRIPTILLALLYVAGCDAPQQLSTLKVWDFAKNN